MYQGNQFYVSSAKDTSQNAGVIYESIELEDFEFDMTTGIFYYPCPCGDLFEIALSELILGSDLAPCPSCSLIVKVLFTMEELVQYSGTSIDEQSGILFFYDAFLTYQALSGF
ncbi:hypothetical protein IE077_001763 [Cardiosporidium cionae]|uniref:Diphthamide biosynthesis protein 3 n=1 Tax=Cardiosporidium cionae TaxID=476202 RepID=A0ABQ7J4Y7_9APIC|nr:hypothetical protein IE077_001763 [Cardiosporidium cionae]|eukprot:KAF8819062.1 hypothetical protein IE077_001763 [Cardiosporidium cionae]